MGTPFCGRADMGMGAGLLCYDDFCCRNASDAAHLIRFKRHRLLLGLPWWMLLVWVIPGWLLSASLASRLECRG